MLKLVLFSLFAIPFIVFLPHANAQYSSLPTPQTNLTSCTVYTFNQVTNPFTLSIDHDPAIAKSVTYSQTNVNASLQMTGADPNQQLRNLTFNPKTHMSFYSNDTNNWQIQITIDHPQDRIGDRTLAVSLVSGPLQQLISNVKTVYQGNHFCGIFQISTIPPVHIMTNQEILKIAQAESNQTIGNLVLEVEKYAGGAQASGNSSGFIGLLIFLLGIALIIMNRVDHKKLKNQEENARLAELSFKSATDLARKQNQYNRLVNDDISRKTEQRTEQVLKQVAESTNHATRQLYNTMEDFVIFMKSELKTSGKDDTKIRMPEKPIQIIMPEEIPQVIEKKQDAISSIPGLGKIYEKVTSKKPTEQKSKAQFWYEEFTKGLEDKYKGKLIKIWEECYKAASENPESDERAKIDAIIRIIDENGGSWPN